jgi:hypothetical protein
MPDDEITKALTAAGAPYGMTAADMATHILLGDRPHPDAPEDVCGAIDPRDETRWCVLAPVHPREGHNRYAPPDGCRTWTAHDDHGPVEGAER